MSVADIILIIILFIVVSVIVYFSFVKHRGDKCYGCPYMRSCNKDKCEKR